MLTVLFLQPCQAKEKITHPSRTDGFGAQFQTIIYSVIYAELNNKEYVYTPFRSMEHNYDNDRDFLEKKERLLNFKDNFEINQGNAQKLGVDHAIRFFESNLLACANSKALNKIKRVFRQNKNRANYLKNDRFNIVIHLRRSNPHDHRHYAPEMLGEALNIINKLRVLYADKKPLLHLHSQGKVEDFKAFNASDIILHLNDSVENSFTSMVLADVLVTSVSSYSYTAALLSEGTIYYMPFWHPPLPRWKTVNELKNL